MQIEIKPQPGPQTNFLKLKCDIAVYGGAAGGGKSYALLLEPLYQFNNPNFGGVIFRRNTVQVRNQGGLWDQSFNLYFPLGANPREANLEWEFPKGLRMKFAHLEYDRTVYDWQGSEIPYIGWDELTHFSEKQFWYMLSRNRSTSGVPGYMRATCNPDADSWVRKLIDWWIDTDGYPIPERAGVIRWFIRDDEKIVWGSSRQELIERFGDLQIPKSFTFVPSNIRDNKILMEKDPSYLSNLMALPRVERLRLLGGNWNIRPSAGAYFQRKYFEVVEAYNAQITQAIRYWDRAATKPNESNKDPDWTRGLKLFKLHNGLWCVDNLVSTRDSPLKVEELIKNTASQDGYGVTICIEQDPGSSGAADVQNLVRLLAGYNVRICKPTKDKITRALPVSAQCEAGNVKVKKAIWNDDFFLETENFPEGAHDDIVDCLSGAFNEMSQGSSILDYYATTARR